MTTFYRQRGHAQPAILWNPAKNSPWYEFANGVCETDDPEAIAKLRELGFSETPIDVKTQAALAITADLTMPQPPPPPRYKDVPAVEPRPKTAGIPPLPPTPPVEKKEMPGELGKKVDHPKPIMRPKTKPAPKAAPHGVKRD